MRCGRLSLYGTLLMILIGLTGCGVGENQSKQEEKVEGFEYSNLYEDKTQKIVAEELLNVGVKKESVETLFLWVNEFNSSITQASAFQEGFSFNDEPIVDYSDLKLEDGFYDRTMEYSDLNCRITAYLLFQPFVTVSNEIQEFDAYLMFDVDAIERDKRLKDMKENLNQFITLFQPVNIEKDSGLEKQKSQIIEAWKERGIEFDSNKEVSLITVFLEDNYENKRFVGHAGVAIEADNELMFIEKYGPNYPYQTSKFSSEDELVEYLLSRPDFYGDGTEEDPIVMKNDMTIH